MSQIMSGQDAVSADDAEEARIPAYNFEFAETNLQRYFKYYTNSEGKMRAECLKCKDDVTRANSGTTKTMGHLQTCNNEAWKLVKGSRPQKSSSAPSSPCTPGGYQPKISVLLKVS
jgi:hypothetical protein